MIAATLLLGAGGVMAERIGNALGWRSEVVTAWTVLAFPLSLAMVVLGVALLYWLAPNTGHEFRWITPGAALFAIAWVLASLLFALYLANFGSYNRTYGSLGAVIILMAWLYWTSFILMAGGELNAVLARREDDTYRAEQGQNDGDVRERLRHHGERRCRADHRCGQTQGRPRDDDAGMYAGVQTFAHDRLGAESVRRPAPSTARSWPPASPTSRSRRSSC